MAATEDWDEQIAAVPEIPEIKLFGKWSSDDVQVSDISLTVSVVSFKAFLLQKSSVIWHVF